MRLKPGVRIGGLKPEMVMASNIVGSVYQNFNKELVITSGTEGSHSLRSAHYRGEAIDTRIYYFAEDILEDVERALKTALGPDFIVLLEDTHFHIEWRPLR